MSTVEQQLENANKYIFVKRYDEAEAILDSIVGERDGQNHLLAHLRRIELNAMLKKLPILKKKYLKDRDEKTLEPLLIDLCLAFIDQNNDSSKPSECIATFQKIIQDYGPCSAAFYGIGFALEQQNHTERAIYSYQESLKLDPSWYPSYFGLSQIYYQSGDEKRGDHYFYLFEQAAPYNVYGNFETHRRLSQEFLQRELYDEAEDAIQALGEWWLENRNHCPVEIQIYELLATASVAAAKGKIETADNRKTRAKGLAMATLDDPSTKDGVLYFVAKILEEFDDFEGALAYYKKILARDNSDPVLIQKIGSQFLAMGEYALAKDLFQAAYEAHPENPDLRFCLLVSNLKMHGVNVEEYLIGRERLRQLAESPSERVELLALLHSLMAKFENDPDVQSHVAEVYLKLGNIDRATRHFKKMYAIDSRNRGAALKYASFEMQYGDPEIAVEALERFSPENLSQEEQSDYYWLKANYFSRQDQHREALDLLNRVLSLDPWNVSYVVQSIVSLQSICNLGKDLERIDEVLESLSDVEDHNIDWTEFDSKTEEFRSNKAYELVYYRTKLRYLYSNGNESSLRLLVTAACQFDASRGAHDFMKLLNTNFDSARIYWALGVMFRELWQLESAIMWFDQMLLYPGLDSYQRAVGFLELADCFIWRNEQLEKAIEFAKVAAEVEPLEHRATRTLAHAYLKAGKVRDARLYLDQISDNEDPETRFLSGLLHYRNGSTEAAKQVWKPLLTHRTENLRFFNIKQEILRFYFDGEPYLKAN